MGIKTSIYIALKPQRFPEDPDERLIALTLYFGGNTFIVGSAGRNYMRMELFEKARINVVLQDYSHPEYRQLY
nr:hypothetical protein [Desulfobacterales bacterium]